jgi:hypothetical protein
MALDLPKVMEPLNGGPRIPIQLDQLQNQG